MTPRAEIWVPKGVSEKDLENLLKPIGGRIDMFQESKPIPIKEIIPSPMATFLKESHPGLEFDPVPTYSEIFSKLRGLPFDEQEKLLVSFYSQKVEAFPNGAELGRFLARINNISWFQPKSRPNEKSLEGLCQQTLSRLNLPKLTLRIINEDWDEALDEARDPTHDAIQATISLGAHLDADGDPTRGFVSEEVLDEARHALSKAEAHAAHDAGAHDATRSTIEHVIWKAVWDANRGEEMDAARDAVQGRDEELDAVQDALLDAAPNRDGEWDEAWEAENPHRYRGAEMNAAPDAAQAAVCGAEWIVAKDLMPHKGYHKGNPFEPLMEIYKLGCWPIGIVPDKNGQREFVVFIPPIPKTAQSPA